MFHRFGTKFAAIDATHNTTHYENMSLFTLLVRDNFGHGIPVAWLLSTNATEDSIHHFLSLVLAQNPDITPFQFMTDRDMAQINSIRRLYTSAKIFLCWWHVLHAWQQHFSLSAYPELWKVLKDWIRMDDEQEFQAQWQKIQGWVPHKAPPSFVDYLKTYWMNCTEMWSATARKGRDVFERNDTNMLLEA